jgi:hypothetical protein
MLRRAKRRRSSGNVSKSASMKISTVSSLGTNLDTNRRVAEIDLVSSSVRSSNDGVGHYRLASQGSPAISDHLRPVQAPKAEQLWSGTVRAVGST